MLTYSGNDDAHCNHEDSSVSHLYSGLVRILTVGAAGCRQLLSLGGNNFDLTVSLEELAKIFDHHVLEAIQVLQECFGLIIR